MSVRAIQPRARSRRCSILLVAVLAVALLVPATEARAAAVVFVDADGTTGSSGCDGTISAPRTVTEALDEVSSGGTIQVCAGEIREPGQVVVDRDVTVRSADADAPATITPGADTGTVEDARGWWLVRPGVTFTLRDVRLHGDGHRIHQAVRFRGQGTVAGVTFADIAYNPQGPDRSGFAVVAYGDGPVEVSGSRFTGIGRVGALFYGVAVSGSRFVDNTYVGKGPGPHLDYGVEIGAGARVTVRDSTITRALGEAEGAVSAGILLSTAFGGDAGLTMSGSTLANNAHGVFADDAGGQGLGPISLSRNAIRGNASLGVAHVGSGAIDATCNWWGASDGPESSGGGGNGASPGVATTPFLTSRDLGGRCASEPLVVPEVSSVTVLEGATVTVEGTYEAGTSTPVTLSASTGSITSSGTNRGTWTWSDRPDDGPGGSTHVTITAANEEVGSAEFDVEVDNVAPSATFDAPATAFTDRPFTLQLRNATDPSAADRDAGLTFAFDCGTGAGYAAVSSESSIDCVLERGGRRTVRGLVRDRDGASREYRSVVDVYDADGDGSPDRSASGTVPARGTVSTGTGEATPSDPIVTRVRTPSGGEITIEEGPAAGTAPPDHELLAWGAEITAPRGSADAPLELWFRLDEDLLPAPFTGAGGVAVGPVVDGELVPPCADDVALPCLDSRRTSGDDLLLLVHATSGGAYDFAAPTVACPSVGVPAPGFADVDPAAAHGPAVACAAAWEVVHGVSPSRYGPARTITRAQVASTLARLLAVAGVELSSSPPDRFSDDDGSVHELAIDQLAELEVMTGRTRSSFAPDATLTRAQLASLLARAHRVMLDRSLAAGPDAFDDDDGTAHERNIDAVAAADLAHGVGERRFDPHGAVRRDQAASFLSRLLVLWVADVRR